MKSIEQITIKESLTELERLHKSSSTFLQPRIHMLIILSKEPVITKSQLSRRLNVAYNSVSKWHQLYKDGGMNALLEIKRGKYRCNNGKSPGFLPEVYAAIEKRHGAEPFQSYVELHKWIRVNFLPNIKYSTLIKYLDIHFDGSFKVTKMVQLSVKETLQELKAIHEETLPRMKPRVEMLIALKQNDRISRFELTDKLKASYGSVIKWSNIYRVGGLEKLLEYKLNLVITPEVFSFIEKQFKENKFNNFSELYRKIIKTYLPDIKYYTLHRYVHRHFSNQIEEAKAFNLPIRESETELEDLYKRSSGDRKKRIKMLQAIKHAPSLSKMELADIAGVAVGSIHRWCKLYRTGGIKHMLEIKIRGRKRLELPTEVHDAIAKEIKQNPDLSIIELYEWVKSFYSQSMSYNKLYRYIRRHFEMPNTGSYRDKAGDYRQFSRVA